MNFRLRVLIFLGGLLLLLMPFPTSQAAILSLNPSSGTFIVGSTFDVSLLLDTQGKSINTIIASLGFSPDKLQLVSPTTGRSVIGLWISQPKFNNATGQVGLEGGIPGGINVSNALVTTLTFRVKGVDSAIIKFLDKSKVLLNDGLGTNDLRQTQSGVYNLVLPPPGGPIVASETHPDQSKWYSNSMLILRWAGSQPIEGYSYVLNDEPIDIPDNISEGDRPSVIYRNISDGTHYFHIKARSGDSWGGVTHFAVNIDTTPSSEFPIKIIPDSRTTRRQPVVEFLATDRFSGIDHYELKLVSLWLNPGDPTTEQPLFIEAQSPYVFPQLELGDYDVIIRAYDKAGNYQEKTERLEIVTVLFKFIKGEGVEIKGWFTVPWLWFWIAIAGFILVLSGIAVLVRQWHLTRHFQLKTKELPDHIKGQLEELKRYRQKYGSALMIFLILSISLWFMKSALAENVTSVTLASPLITTISRNISNEEIFYAGGKVDTANTIIIIYLQNLQTGETMSQSVQSDKRGDWFYRHTNFLSTGNYILWAQTKLGDELSPPSPQIQMTVRPTAIQFGASRLSYETLYFIISLILFLAVIGLISFIIFHALQGRKKTKQFWKEVREAEESIRRGFAVLRRDIEAELAVITKAKLSKILSEDEKEKEERLLKDLDWVQKYISKEVWDIEKTEH